MEKKKKKPLLRNKSNIAFVTRYIVNQFPKGKR